MDVLLVTDWTVDPHAVVGAAVSRAEGAAARFGLVVPAWLHGLDWAGDPFASVPCAQRQLDAIVSLAAAAGLTLGTATGGDPDPVTAIYDTVEHWPPEEILIFGAAHRFARGPF